MNINSDPSIIETLTKNWLQEVCDQNELPMLLRSHLMKQLFNSENQINPRIDFCIGCSLKYSKGNTKLLIKRTGKNIRLIFFSSANLKPKQEKIIYEVRRLQS